MKPPVTQRLDDFGRCHPRLMLVALMALACVATIVLLASGEKTVVLYQAF
jgi:hypothetical protein